MIDKVIPQWLNFYNDRGYTNTILNCKYSIKLKYILESK